MIVHLANAANVALRRMKDAVLLHTTKQNQMLKQQRQIIVLAINFAIEKGLKIYITYDGGTNVGAERLVQPKQWQNNVAFIATCEQSNMDKTYLLSKVRSIRSL